MIIGEACAWAKEMLASANEAQELICAVLQCSREALILRYKNTMPSAQLEMLETMVKHRKRGMPLQYLLGEWDFMGMPMKCTPGVLIPRGDTEVLAMSAIEASKKFGYSTALDMCCGSGCVGIALAAWGGLEVTCCDINDKALELTYINAQENGVNLQVKNSDMFEQIVEKYDIITCNPPYIPSADIDSLPDEVRLYEPRLALDGGEDGLEYYRILAENARIFLNDGGALIVEIGIGQRDELLKLFHAAGFTKLRSIDDLADIPRVIEAYI